MQQPTEQLHRCNNTLVGFIMMARKIFYVLSGNTVYQNTSDGREMLAEVHDSLCVSEAYETSS